MRSSIHKELQLPEQDLQHECLTAVRHNAAYDYCLINKHLYHDIRDHQGHWGLLPVLEQKPISGKGLGATVCK